MVKKSTTSDDSVVAGDCSRPACDDVMTMMQQAASSALSTRTNVSATRGESASTAAAAAVVAADECPLGSAELGRSSWALLHSMAAWYPDKPSDQDQKHMQRFMAALARFYPCTWCAQDFQQSIKKEPVQTQSRKDLCIWLCEQHNVVNAKTGKPLFLCDMNALDERWRKSDKKQCSGSSLH